MMPLVPGDRLGVDLGHHQRHARFHAERRGVVDHHRAWRTAAGAKRFDCAPPAENSAMSTPSKLSSVSSSTAMSWPRNCSVCPAERAGGEQPQLGQRKSALLEAAA